jgi:GntP family gluconate:H+ symporter
MFMWPQILTFLSMIGAFLLIAAGLRQPAALATAGAAFVGLAASGRLDQLHHLVEGAFGYFDVLLIIAMAMVFMAALESAGILEEISTRITRRLGKRPMLLSLASMLLVMAPGMLTGSSTAAALTTGRFVLPVLMEAGVPLAKAGAFVALGAILGMVAPPVNVPVMIIGSGIDMPYVGFDLPLLAIALPPAIAASVWVARSVRRPGLGGRSAAATASEAGGTGSATEGGRDASSRDTDSHDDERRIPGFKVYIPILVLLAMMLAVRVSNGSVPDPGIPLMFAVGAVLAMLCGRPVRPWEAIERGIGLALPVMGVLVGAGMFVQVATVTGVRGFLVVSALDIPMAWVIVVAVLALPAFGAISAYASSSVMGVPILLALLGNNEVVTAAALSLLAALGDLLPPIAIVPSLISQATQGGAQTRGDILRRLVVPGVLLAAWAYIVLRWAPAIGRLLS